MDRAEDDLKLDFGEVFHDVEGVRWVFIGWRQNTAGMFPMFCKEQQGELATHPNWGYTIHWYHAAITKTLLRKFPDLERKLKV